MNVTIPVSNQTFTCFYINYVNYYWIVMVNDDAPLKINNSIVLV